MQQPQAARCARPCRRRPEPPACRLQAASSSGPRVLLLWEDMARGIGNRSTVVEWHTDELPSCSATWTSPSDPVISSPREGIS